MQDSDVTYLGQELQRINDRLHFLIILQAIFLLIVAAAVGLSTLLISLD